MADPSNLPEPGPCSAAARLRNRREVIQAKWLERVRAEVPAAAEQPDPALIDNLPNMLDALAAALEHANTPGHERELFTCHAEERIDWTNYSAEELMREYGILRKVLFSELEGDQPLTPGERDVVLDFIDQGIQLGSVRFSEVQRFHQRLELQYLKLIEHLVAESAHAGAEGGLERLLDVILNDLRAEAVAFFLYDEGTLELTLSSAAAKSKQLAELYRGALALSCATAPDAAQTEAVRLIELDRLEPAARENLRMLDVEWLVCVKVFARGRLPGTLCLGFRERRTFDPVEIHQLEMLGDRLALLLASIQLQDQSKAALELARRENVMIEAERNSLDEERRRRDELIATISHDLKNPLSTAKLGAELIRKGPATTRATERLADQILSSIGRSDRMIHDLLDAQRIRAGKRLPMGMKRYPMNDLVAEVVAEMKRLHGDRFVVQAVPDVTGYWSWDGMRRVVENLLSNAVKYSDPHSPITISVSVADGDKMALSVHNHGPALSPDEQARIFRPFERGQSAERSGKRGWGIGLTLVQGIVDAHGGRVTVDSTPGGGTTFSVKNPMDSRPYQEQDAAS